MLVTHLKLNDARALFFDRDKVTSALSEKEQKVLSRAGRFVQRKARGMIKKRKKPSKPGSSPTRQSERYYNSILFHADLKARSVQIGPVKLNNVFFGGDGQPVTGPVPEVLEEGGVIQVLEVRAFPDSMTETEILRVLGRRRRKTDVGDSLYWKRADLRSKRSRGFPGERRRTDRRLRRVEIKPRPHMLPAFEAELPKFPELFRGQL